MSRKRQSGRTLVKVRPNEIGKRGRASRTNERVRLRDIVVIGGSAGSLGPLKQLVSGLPADLPAAIFVTLHVSAESPGVLPGILTRAGQIPAVYPLNKQPIMKSTIYIAPPDQHLLIEDGWVFTSRGPRENLSRPAIDPMFRSAARAYGPRVMGIILSGLLDDGASGLMAVKMRGGLAVVQDPAEAPFPDMPRRAEHYARADYALPVAQIEQLIVSSANGRRNGEGGPGGEEQAGGAAINKKLSVEVENANIEEIPVREQLGMPSVYACPDCHGVLWEVKERDLVRYRCRVGHSYTEETLNVAFSKATENALWASMRALEEKAQLLRGMALRSERRAAARYEEEAATIEKHASAIRDMLAEEGSAAVASEE